MAVELGNQGDGTVQYYSEDGEGRVGCEMETPVLGYYQWYWHWHRGREEGREVIMPCLVPCLVSIVLPLVTS